MTHLRERFVTGHALQPARKPSEWSFVTGHDFSHPASATTRMAHASQAAEKPSAWSFVTAPHGGFRPAMAETVQRTAGLLTGCSAGVLTRTCSFFGPDFSKWSFVTGHAIQAARKPSAWSCVPGHAPQAARNLPEWSFVTGHDFSRADKPPLLKIWALAPAMPHCSRT